jgi:hypothetical protein
LFVHDVVEFDLRSQSAADLLAVRSQRLYQMLANLGRTVVKEQYDPKKKDEYFNRIIAVQIGFSPSPLPPPFSTCINIIFIYY